MKAVILAGGEGTRLLPLTKEIPKPLIPVQSKPVIQYLVENFINFGCEEVIIIIKKDKRQFNQFANWGIIYQKTKKVNPKRMSLMFEAKPLGTLGALSLVRKRLKNEERFFVTNADELKDVDLKKLKHTSIKSKAMATMVIQESRDNNSFGNLIFNKKTGKIDSFEEKTKNGLNKFINLGMYCFTQNIFKYLQEGFQMLEVEAFPEMSNKGELFGYHHKGQFFPTDDFDKWGKAIEGFKYKKPKY